LLSFVLDGILIKGYQLFADTIINKYFIWEMKEQTFLKEKTQSYEPKAHWCHGGRAAKPRMKNIADNFANPSPGKVFNGGLWIWVVLSVELFRLIWSLENKGTKDQLKVTLP
jgi:hypothetical protein